MEFPCSELASDVAEVPEKISDNSFSLPWLASYAAAGQGNEDNSYYSMSRPALRPPETGKIMNGSR